MNVWVCDGVYDDVCGGVYDVACGDACDGVYDDVCNEHLPVLQKEHSIHYRVRLHRNVVLKTRLIGYHLREIKV